MCYTIFHIKQSFLSGKWGSKKHQTVTTFKVQGTKIIRLGKQHTTIAAEVGCIRILMLTEPEIWNLKAHVK